MQISGQMKTICPPDFLLNVLRDPNAMRQLLPAGSRLDQSDDGTYPFTMTKSVGPIRLTLPGTLTLTPQAEGFNHLMTVRASHMIAGKVSLDLHIDITQAEGQTRITYQGELDATGLAGRILNEHRARANGVLKASMIRLKMHAERQFAKSGATA